MSEERWTLCSSGRQYVIFNQHWNTNIVFSANVGLLQLHLFIWIIHFLFPSWIRLYSPQFFRIVSVLTGSIFPHCVLIIMVSHYYIRFPSNHISWRIWVVGIDKIDFITFELNHWRLSQSHRKAGICVVKKFSPTRNGNENYGDFFHDYIPYLEIYEAI